ncbi:Ger(x)C family spore germination protein [Paenibacillus sp. GCM10027627]|uniref:Ger(x)C family spore germination protein n=1 Tax=unclassified Paenibacillus TaxID=185978 RepID=UPI003629F626
MRMACRKLLVALSCFSLLLGSCTHTPEIQDMAYATAIGVDFKKGKWIAYAQILNFTNIARTEQVALGKSVPVWVGKGEGDTLAMALTDISRTSQIKMFWGHVEAVVMTESVLKKGVKDVYATINRYREVRYNVLVYGTKRELPDILTQKSILNLSPLDATLFMDTHMGSTHSTVIPVAGNQVIAALNETGEPAYIPSIDIDSLDWTEDKKPKPMFKVSGKYFFRNKKMSGWMSERDLLGSRWAESKLERTPLEIKRDEKPIAVLMFAHPKLFAQPVAAGDSVKFNIYVEAKAIVMDMVQKTSIKQMSDCAEDDIRKEIIATFRKALKAECDPFRLGEALYRWNPRLFKKEADGKPYFLTEDHLGKIEIEVVITTTGKYKGTPP